MTLQRQLNVHSPANASCIWIAARSDVSFSASCAAAADRHIGFVMTHTDERSLNAGVSQLKNSQHECFSRTLLRRKTTSSTIRCISMLFMALHQCGKNVRAISPCGVGLIGIICISRRISGETRTATFSNIIVAPHLQWQPPLYRHA